MEKQEIIQQIADKIIEAANFKALPEEARAVFKENLEAQIIRRLGLIIMQHMDEQGLEAYEKLTQGNATPSSGEMQSFLEQYLPDYEEKVKVGMEEFIKELGEILNNSK